MYVGTEFQEGSSLLKGHHPLLHFLHLLSPVQEEIYTRSEHSFRGLFATMRALFQSFILIAHLGVGVLALPSDDDIAIRAEDTGDNLDEWLTAAQRVSPDALKACPSSCNTASNRNRKFGLQYPRGPADFNQ